MSLTEGDRAQLYQHVTTEGPSAALVEWAGCGAKRQQRHRHYWLSLDLHLPGDVVSDLNRIFRMPLATKAQAEQEEILAPDVLFEDSEDEQNYEPPAKNTPVLPTVEPATPKLSQKQNQRAEALAIKQKSDDALAQYKKAIQAGPGLKRSWEDLRDKQEQQRVALSYLKKIKKEPKKEPK